MSVILVKNACDLKGILSRRHVPGTKSVYNFILLILYNIHYFIKYIDYIVKYYNY